VAFRFRVVCVYVYVCVCVHTTSHYVRLRLSLSLSIYLSCTLATEHKSVECVTDYGIIAPSPLRPQYPSMGKMYMILLLLLLLLLLLPVNLLEYTSLRHNRVIGWLSLFPLSIFFAYALAQHHGTKTDHVPEVILNNFSTRLGHRVGRLLGSLMPHVRIV
jgi:hypothetical protein